ncbi:Cytochrome b561 domain-containing protein [Glycine soja]
MGVQQKLSAFLFQLSMFLLVSASQEHKKAKGRHSSKKDHNIKTSVRNHTTWVSLVGFNGVLNAYWYGILVIRLSNREGNQRRLRIIFYVHAVLQESKLAVLLATAGAIMSIKSFNNSFSNNHQRLGVALYCIIWLQVLGIQKKKSLVLCTQGSGNCSVITGCAECIYRFTSLPRKNIQKHNNLEYTFHRSDIFDCDLLPSSIKMGLHTKPGSDLGQLITDSYLIRKKASSDDKNAGMKAESC